MSRQRLDSAEFTRKFLVPKQRVNHPVTVGTDVESHSPASTLRDKVMGRQVWDGPLTERAGLLEFRHVAHGQEIDRSSSQQDRIVAGSVAATGA
jgi:hypothetical protein